MDFSENTLTVLRYITQPERKGSVLSEPQLAGLLNIPLDQFDDIRVSLINAGFITLSKANPEGYNYHTTDSARAYAIREMTPIDLQSTPYKKPNSIIRVKEIVDYEHGSTKEVYLTTYKEYLKSKTYTEYGKQILPYPYIGLDLRWIYEKPAFMIHRLFSKNSRLTALNPTHIAIKIAIIFIETSIGFFVTKFFLEKIFKK